MNKPGEQELDGQEEEKDDVDVFFQHTESLRATEPLSTKVFKLFHNVSSIGESKHKYWVTYSP